MKLTLPQATKFKIAFALAIFIAGCSPASRPESALIGRWQSEETPSKEKRQATVYQFQFFADGSVARNEQINGRWQQEAAGTFKFVDKTHVKIDLTPSWFYGTTIHEVEWRDRDHVSLRVGDQTMQLTRLK